MSDIEARVKKIIAEQLGVPEAEVVGLVEVVGAGVKPNDAKPLGRMFEERCESMLRRRPVMMRGHRRRPGPTVVL